jgi:Bacteriophage protein GP30.3
MNIQSGCGYPASKLSNFAPNKFIFDGVECASMEGLLQSFKFDNHSFQKYVCTLVGIQAKSKGRNKKWWVKQKLYWKGVAYERKSQEYQELLDRAYMSLAQNDGFRKALLATGNANLTHSIGKNKQNETILTKNEFCSRLMKMREMIKNGEL